MRHLRLIPLITALLSLPALAQTTPTFERDVQPIFQKRCFGCHSPEASSLKGRYDLSTAALALKGGASGPSIVPGDAAGSPLVQMIEWAIEPEMPPKGKFQKLPQEEIDVVKAWIAAGAHGGDAALQAVLEEPVAPPAPEPAPAEASSISGTAAAPISAIAISPDGALLARGSLRQVELLQLSETGDASLLHTLDGHAEMVRSLAFSPDGTMLAAAGGLPGRNGEVKIWRVADGELLRTLEGHTDNILDAAFSPDGAQLATASYDKLVMLWSVETGETLHILKDHVDAVFALDYSPDGKILASGAGDRTVKLWDVETGQRMITLSDSLDAVLSLAFAPDGRHIAAGAADKMIRVWDVEASGGGLRQTALTSGVLVHSAFAHEGPVLQLVYSADGATLFSASEDGHLKAWDTASMTERMLFEPQSDWVQTLALSGEILAVGRFDATSAVYRADTGARVWPQDDALDMRAASAETERKVPGAGRINVEAVFINATIPPSITAINPVRHPRGTELELTVEGKNLAEAEPFFTDSRIAVEVISTEALPIPEFTYNPARLDAQIFDFAQPYRLKLKVTLPEDLPPGGKALMCRTPIGLTNPTHLDVLVRADVAEVEPNYSGAEVQTLALPSTIIGALNHAADVDRYRVEVEAGQEVVFAITDSLNNTVLRLRDAQGNLLARSEDFGVLGNPRLGHRFETAGSYFIEFSDPNMRNLGYRLHAGPFPYVYRTEPLGIPAGTPQSVRVHGFNIGAEVLEVTPPETATPGQTMPLPIPAHEANPVSSVQLALGQYPETPQTLPNHAPEQAQPINAPGTVNARMGIGEQGAHDDWYRFTAKAGEVLVLQVDAAKLGSRLDAIIEVCDLEGRVLQRAQARCVAQTMLTLSDRDSRSGGLRIEDWSDFRVNDYVMVGSEIVRATRLPGYADEDIQLATYPGQRKGFFGTTPEFHAVGSPVYKVEIHPVDAQFPPNGMPIFPIYWRNDDHFEEGKPQGDSRLDFEAPADGDYLLRVRSATGAGGEDYQYRLTLRPLQPGYDIVVDPYWINLSPGKSEPLNVRVRRHDGFDGPVRVALQGLPEGFAATEAVVLEGQDDAVIALTAAPGAASTDTGATFALAAAADIGDAEVARETRIGAITVSQKQPDLIVQPDKERLALKPGHSGWLSVTLGRNNGFSSRVPINLLNLPFGVRVLDTGLNGILVREGETERSMEIYVEPWVKPIRHTIYIQARIESASPGRMLFISQPIELDLTPSQETLAAAE